MSEEDPRVTLAKSLFDAELPSLKLGYGHGSENVKYALTQMIRYPDRGDEYLQRTIRAYVHPRFQDVTMTALMRILASAMKASEEAS